MNPKITHIPGARLNPTAPHHKQIIESWGKKLWHVFGSIDRREKPLILIFGEWSGYTPSQKRIAHVQWSHFKDIGEGYKGAIKFTDGTFLNVWTERVTRREILSRGIFKRETYSELVSKLIRSGESIYIVK